VRKGRLEYRSNRFTPLVVPVPCAAELIDWNRCMHGRGMSDTTEIDWQDLMDFKRTFTETVPENREKGMEKVGITPVSVSGITFSKPLESFNKPLRH